MRILIFSWRDIKNPAAGGAEVLTMELAKRWTGKNHEVSILTSHFPGAKNQEVLDNIKIYRAADFFYSPLSYFQYLFSTSRFYHQNLRDKFDLVIDQVHGLPFFTPFYVREKVIFFPFEVAREIWNWEVPFPYSLFGQLLEFLYIKIFKNAPFVTISPSTACDLKIWGVKNVSVFTPGINFKSAKNLPKKDKTPLIVSLGRITPMKRITDTIQAYRLLYKEFPEIKLVIIGKGKNDYLEALKDLCLKMGIEDRVLFAGYLTEPEKRKILSKAWVLVSTSIKEGWGLIVTEAAACGTPTVAYKIAGLCDSVKNNKTGILCSKNNPVELHKNLKKVLIDSKLRQILSRNALQFSRKLSWDKAAGEVLRIFEKKC